MYNEIAFIVTGAGVSFPLNGTMRQVAKTESFYDDVLSVLVDQDDYGDPAAEIQDILDRVANRLMEESTTNPNVHYNAGSVSYKGVEMSPYLTDRMIGFLGEGLPMDAYYKFLDNLALNPSYQTRQDLEEFLKFGKMPITKDGTFLAYKAVTIDWFDIHTRTNDNSIGRIVKMPRENVNDNRNDVCSAGLHVCSFDYLPGFAHASGHVVVVEINPKDVVAVPTDYHNTKMRVCEYKVIGEVEGYYGDKHANDVLAGETKVWFDESDDDVDDEDYPYKLYTFTDADGWQLYDSYSEQDYAVERATALVMDEDSFGIAKVIYNGVTLVVISK